MSSYFNNRKETKGRDEALANEKSHCIVVILKSNTIYCGKTDHEKEEEKCHYGASDSSLYTSSVDFKTLFSAFLRGLHRCPQQVKTLFRSVLTPSARYSRRCTRCSFFQEMR